jgi:hypothetical protein
MFNTVTFDGINGLSFSLNEDKTPMQKFEMEVDWRFEEVALPQGHGIFPSHSLMGKRIIHCEGVILCDSSEEYMETRMGIMGALVPFSPGEFTEIGTVTIDFIGFPEPVIADVTLENFPSLPIEALMPARGDYRIDFKAFDPRFYGLSEQSGVVVPGASILGRQYPKTYPRSYTIPLTAATTSEITNSGNLDTFVTGVITGPITSPSLQIVLGPNESETLTFNGLTLGATDYVQFDMRAQTAVMNGSTNVYSFAAGSNWWKLPIGTWTVRLLAFDYSGSASASLNWRNAYNI